MMMMMIMMITEAYFTAVAGVFLQGAAKKSKPLSYFVNISTTNRNFCKKIYTTIYHSYLRITAELY